MAKLYKVIDMIERSSISRQGKMEKVWRVTAESHGGTTFTVEIPATEFNKEKVDQILTDEATKLDDIKKL